MRHSLLLRGLPLLVAAFAVSASAQDVTFNWNTSDSTDTQGWTYTSEADEPDGFTHSVTRTANPPMTPFEGTRSLEAAPLGAGPFTNVFRGATRAYSSAVDLSSAGTVSYQFNIYGSSPESEIFEQRFRVTDGSGQTSSFTSRVTKNSWNAVSFDVSDLEGDADLADVVAISIEGRNPDNRGRNEDGEGDEGADAWGGRVQVDVFSIELMDTSSGTGPGLASLGNVYPNPAAAGATLAVGVEAAQRVTATVFDVLGRRVATAFDGPLAPGSTSLLRFDAGSLAPGTYVVRVQGETFTASRRLTVAR